MDWMRDRPAEKAGLSGGQCEELHAGTGWKSGCEQPGKGVTGSGCFFERRWNELVIRAATPRRWRWGTALKKRTPLESLPLYRLAGESERYGFNMTEF